MFEVLVYPLVLAIAAIGTILFLAATRPSHFHSARSLRIDAPPEDLHALISNLREMNRWSPYALRETVGSPSYAGPESGPGATFHFQGPKSGAGSIRVVECTPLKIVMRLLMTKPLTADNRIEFTLEPDGGTTKVTWAMSGPQPIFARVMSLFINFDRMIGRDFDEGLANLKTIAETAIRD